MRTSITPPEIDRRQAMRASEERELALRSALTALVKLPYHGALVPPAGPYVLVSDVHPIVLSALASSSSGDAGTGAEGHGKRIAFCCECGAALVYESSAKGMEYWRCPTCHNSHWWRVDERSASPKAGPA